MLSSLAEGADRLTARIALRSNMRLVAVLPLPQDRYEEDFTTPEVLTEFRALLERSIGVIRLPLLDGITDDQIKTPGDARNREYAKAGAYITAHSQVFFAFWDGTPHTGDKVGGTAQTVDFRMQGAQAPYVGRRSGRMFGVAAGPVLHIATPRTSNPASASLTPKLTRLLPPNMREDAFDRICERMDAFNRDAKTIRDVLGRGVPGPPGRIAEHARLGCPVDVRTASGRVPEGRRTLPRRRRPRAAVPRARVVYLEACVHRCRHRRPVLQLPFVLFRRHARRPGLVYRRRPGATLVSHRLAGLFDVHGSVAVRARPEGRISDQIPSTIARSPKRCEFSSSGKSPASPNRWSIGIYGNSAATWNGSGARCDRAT